MSRCSDRAAQDLGSLLLPPYWKPSQLLLDLQIRRLPPVQDALDDVRRQQSQLQDTRPPGLRMRAECDLPDRVFPRTPS